MSQRSARDVLRSRALCVRVSLCFSFACVLTASRPSGSGAYHIGSRAEPAITLAFAGDVMLGRGVAASLDGEWEDAFAALRLWLRDTPDVAFANLESPLTDRVHLVDGHDLRAPQDAVEALRSGGFNVVSLANNHSLDSGPEGLHDTVATLEAAGITALLPPGAPSATAGSHSVEGAPDLAFVALDDSRNPLDLAHAAQVIRAAAQESELVVVSVHWGGEYQAEPSDRQRSIARALSSAGASAIIGHGPHVLQPVEWVGGTLVAFSLGNLLFDQPYPMDCRLGAILLVTFQGRDAVSVTAVPTMTHRGRTRVATGDEARAALARLDLTGAAAPIPIIEVEH